MAAAAPALQNYEFLPAPAVVPLGGRLKLTMAGCVGPANAVSTCPAPSVLADGVSAAAGSLRQTSPTEFEYIAPAVMPARPLVEIRASYQGASRHEVLGMVILVDPRLAVSATGAVTNPGGGPKKPGSGAPKYLRYTGFVQVFNARPDGPWLRNQFWVEADDDTRKTYDGPGGDDYLFVRFKRLVGSMNMEYFDPSHKHLEYAEGREVFDGEEEVFAYLSINLTRQRYGWQVHGDRLGDRPPSGSAYMDPGYNSSCRNASFDTGKEATLPYTDLTMLTGQLDCAAVAEGGAGVVMSWYFVPMF